VKPLFSKRCSLIFAGRCSFTIVLPQPKPRRRIWRVFSHAALKRTGYDFDFARRYDLVRAAIGLVERGDNGVSVVSINRSERQPAFHGQDANLLSALIPHLRRGLQLHKRLLSADIRVTDLSGVVEAMPHAVMLVNAWAESRWPTARPAG
jgi:hypothetical protein